MNINPFLATDGYKTGHHKMYPQGTTLVYSNFTPRGGKHSNIKDGKGVISFGQQMVMKQITEMFDENFFFAADRKDKIDYEMSGGTQWSKFSHVDGLKDKVCQEIKKEYSLYLGEDYDVSHIEALWDLGYLPIKVKVIPEGSFVPYRVPILTIVNTNPKFFWLTNFLETLISNMLWMPVTAATTAYEYRKVLGAWQQSTDGENEGFVPFQGHNFGMRGMAGLDATLYAGIGHGTSFIGDDSLPTIHGARKYYGETGAVVHSVNATEHSVMCAGGDEDELGTFRYLMKQFPKGILSIVSDTWNLWDVLTKFLPELRSEILKRDGKIVIRPDSGDPVDIICGYTRKNCMQQSKEDKLAKRWYPNKGGKWIEEPEYKGVVELLWDVFGGTVNSQGYKVLDPHIGAIYGDSITIDRADEICKRLADKGFASTNVVLGIGSFTYQFVTRDTHGFAMKATYVEIDQWEYFDNIETFQWVNITPSDMDAIIAHGLEPEPEFRKVKVEREIFKDPITDDGLKKSAKGLLRVSNNNEGDFILVDQVDWMEESRGFLKTIFEDGKFINEVTLTDIRRKLWS